MPHALSLRVLRSLRINANQLVRFRLGFCPMLEFLDLKDNQISLVDPLFGAPLLRNVDASFNQL